MAAHITRRPSLARAVVTGPRSILRRLGAHWGAIELDRALASGVDPQTTAAIAAHADSLRSRRAREALAASIYLALRDASFGTSPFSMRVPIARDAVERNRSELLALAAELRQATGVSARGVAALRLLVGDGAGPLYCDDGSGALDAAVLEVSSWL